MMCITTTYGYGKPIGSCRGRGTAAELVKIIFVSVLFLILSTSSVDQTTAHTFSSRKLVFVSEITGTDELSCIELRHDNITTNAPSPCKSIHFAYTESLKRMSNSTKALNIILMDEVYHLNQTLNIDVPDSHLQILEISSVNKHKTLISAHTSSSHISRDEANVRIACMCCRHDLKMARCHFYNVSLFNLKFSGFGPMLPAAVVLWQVKFVNISGCVFNKNRCSGINALDSGMEITWTDFVDNNNNINCSVHQCFPQPFTFPLSNISSGGAIGVIFNQGVRARVLIGSCNFIGNSAIRSDKESQYIKHSPSNISYYRVGAGLLFSFSNTSNFNQIHLVNNNITCNKGFSGVGLTVITQDYAHNNLVKVQGSLFSQNEAESTSAGILFASWDYSNNNKLLIESCKILNNTADISAGIKAVFHSVTPNKTELPAPQTVHISKSIFCGNNAHTASGLHFICALPTSYKLPGSYWVDNSTFCNHITSKKYGSKLKSNEKHPLSAYGGTVLTNRVDIYFQGDSYIFHNHGGSALYSSNSEIHICGSLEFSDNKAQASGGAMSLADVSHLVLHTGAHLRFLRNYARINGGAIAIYTLGIPELVYQFNPTCFLQYSESSVPPSKWNVTLEFIKNGAGLKGAAIFINTLTSCLWSDKPPYVSFHNALRWNKKSFVYKDNYLTLDVNVKISHKNDRLFVLTPDVDISTDTSNFILGGPKTVEAAPGEEVEFNLTATDELGNPIYSVPIANNYRVYPNQSHAVDYIQLNKQYYVIPPVEKTNPVLSYSIDEENYRKFNVKENFTHQISFVDSYSSFLSDAEMVLKPVPCRPGFYFEPESETCVCDTKQNAILRCEGTLVYLYKGYFAHVSGNKLVTYNCPNNYCKCNSPHGRDVLGCEFDFRHPEKQCALNREGPLCGACAKNLTVSLRGARCIVCDDQIETSLVFVGVLLFVAIVCILVVVLNPSFSTKMRGAMFYVQILPYIVGPYDEVGKIVMTAASSIDLAGPAGLPVNGCLMKGLNNLHIIALSYLFPVTIFVVLGVTYCLGRTYIINLKRDSPFESFWILMVAIYTLLAEASLLFHFCVPFAGKRLFFYDGTFECYHGQHLIMVTTASLVLLIFVLPPPILVLLICFGYVRVDPQVTDALTKGLRKEFRWWWSVDLSRRLVFVAIYVFIPGLTTKKVFFIVACLCVLVLHSQCQPYISKWANLGETFLLFGLTNLATLQLVDEDDCRDKISASILVVTNFYVLVIALYLTVNFIRFKCRRKGYTRVTQVPVDNVPPVRPLTPGKRYSTPTRVLGYPIDNN